MREERKDRQREARGGSRSFEACKRAKQEAPSILCSSLGVGLRLFPSKSLGISGSPRWGSPRGFGTRKLARRGK